MKKSFFFQYILYSLFAFKTMFFDTHWKTVAKNILINVIFRGYLQKKASIAFFRQSIRIKISLSIFAFFAAHDDKPFLSRIKISYCHSVFLRMLEIFESCRNRILFYLLICISFSYLRTKVYIFQMSFVRRKV